MARKPALSIDSLEELGTEKLAKLILDEAERSASFRKLVAAALAGVKGPEAVAKLIDRRIGALEKARGLIELDRARAFRDDLRATVATMADELGKASPAMAIERLLRLVATHEPVFERVDDSSGEIQEVYYDAIAAIGDLAAKLKADEADLLPDSIMASLGQSTHGYLVDVAEAVTGQLPEATLSRWDGMLAVLQREQEIERDGKQDGYHSSNVSQLRNVRQAIANARGDLDGVIALEEQKHPNSQDTIGIAERLLEAARPREALDWVRKESHSPLKYMSHADLADGAPPRDAPSPRRASLEARILETLGEKQAAQSLRWAVFEDTLNAGMLRDYIDALPDFDEFEGLDRAFAHALGSKRLYLALEFFLEWPRLDLAAKVVVDNHCKWAGQLYHILLPAAEALAHGHPVAATILYRALLDDILTRARSKAYPHAARYLKRLDELAVQGDEGSAQYAGIDPHAAYRSALRKNHSRKTGFWAFVPQER